MTAPTTSDPRVTPPTQTGPKAATVAGEYGSPLAAVPGTLRRARYEQIALALFIVVPFAAVLAAVPVVWGWGLGWRDVGIAFVMYAISGHGITVGYHRYFTHGSFKARRWVRVALAVAGSLAIEGPVIRWVADHRRHHAYSDKDGDPHSPWRFCDDLPALAKGFWFAHVGWLFDVEHTNREKYTPDLMRDKDIRVVNALFPALVIVSLGLPALIGGLVTMSWAGALSAFFWASLVRIFVLHHVTWSINSVCHMIGSRPFAARDKSANFWPLAILSFGESWHNMHHADPTAARHGVLRGQLDSSARVIWIFEKLGWATDVRWPKPERLAKLRVAD